MTKLIFNTVVTVLLVSLSVSCGKMNDVYKDFVKGGAINYTGKVDSVKVFPGKNRIQFTYQLRSDPKIIKTVIYWNNRKDSMVEPIQRKPGIDTITTLIPQIAEGTYTFTFVTYDNQGNSSVSVDIPGNVYGSNYESFLTSRPMRTSEMTPQGDALITWYTADPLMIGTEMSYTGIDDEEKVVMLPASELEGVMEDFKDGAGYSYRTMYQPEPNMIDTLYSAPASAEILMDDVTHLYLLNPGNPFEYATYDGTRYGTLKDWTVTANVNNQGGFGSFDNIDEGAYMSISKMTDENAAVTNGKISQAVNLQAGEYNFIVYFNGKPEAGYSIAAGTGSRVAAALGTTIPNTPSAANSLGFSTLSPRTSIAFQLTEPKQVALGIWSTMLQNTNYFRAVKVKLTKRK